MSWGISPNANEKEKLKSEYADFLQGLNSCCEISWKTYNDLFDLGMGLFDRMYELGKQGEVDGL